jgi:carboxyl-terminal processing protease
MKNKNKIYFSILAITLAITSAFVIPTDKYFEITRNLDIFASLYKEVNAYYVDEVDPQKSIRTGINAMLESLDPYTNYIPEEDLEAYVTMTTGEYGGIGAMIGNLNDKVIVTMPNEGFPAEKAGIKIGDEIIQINDTNTVGKETSEISALLKGNAGTNLTVKVKRGDENLSFELTRAKIIIDNVPYAGMIADDIGYIKLTEFTTNAAKEVKEALTTLKKNGANKIILDVRGNPGGILQEAVAICNLFIPKQKVVVETKGKTPNWNNVYKTSNRPVDMEIPLVVLTSSGSASAAEIVAGTLQDYDRGVLIGRKTFGKGLVQTTRPLGYNSQLKLTVAKYYTPSGRCIQAIDYSHRNPDGSIGKIPDSLKVAFKTANGRTVYDGGGITPDIAVPSEYLSSIALSLMADAHIFNFATQYYYTHPKAPDMNNFEVSDELYQEFMATVNDVQLNYDSDLENAVEQFEAAVKKSNQIDELKDELNQLKIAVQHNQEKDLITHQDQIRSLLAEEIIARYYLLKGEIANSITHDPDVTEAIALLNDPNQYNSLLAKKQ